MRFMFIIKTDAKAAPTPALMEAVHKMAEREIAAGRMIQDGGLAPRDSGMEIRLKSGKLVVTDGPFAETKELIGGFALFELPDMDAAVASGREFMKLHQDFMPGWEGTMEIRQVAGSMVQMIRGG